MLKLRYRKEILTTDFNVDSNRIISNLKFFLSENESRHIVDGNKIGFKRIVRRSTHTGNNKYEAIKIFREGSIEQRRLNDKIMIDSEVRLETLAFMAFLISIMVGIVSHIFIHIGLIIGLFVGIICFILFFLIGYIRICLIIKLKFRTL